MNLGLPKVAKVDICTIPNVAHFCFDFVRLKQIQVPVVIPGRFVVAVAASLILREKKVRGASLTSDHWCVFRLLV